MCDPRAGGNFLQHAPACEPALLATIMASPLERGSCEQGKLPEDEAGGDMVQPRCDNEAPKPAAGVGCVSSSGGSTVAIEAGPAPLEATSLSYVSLITSDSFLPGVQVLVHSLRSTGTRHPIHIMATPQVSRGARRRVRSFGATVLSVRSGCHVPEHAAVCQRLNAGGAVLARWTPFPTPTPVSMWMAG